MSTEDNVVFFPINEHWHKQFFGPLDPETEKRLDKLVVALLIEAGHEELIPKEMRP